MINIQILLATYNGSRYLGGFLDSLVGQSCQEWSLLVRDDGSTDDTPALLQKWSARLGDRIAILPESGHNMGAVGNFSRLLAASTAPYVMFADQDDVWNPDKISLTLAAMFRREEKTGSSRPILVHTDLHIVDDSLETVAPSHWKHQGLVPERGASLGRVLMENTVWGCTSMLNRSLANLTGEIPVEARFHDWWIALVAAAFGETVPLPVQTINWRRHGASYSEITNQSEVILRTLTGVRAMSDRLAKLLEENRPRVRLFLGRYRDRLQRDQIAAIEAFLMLPSIGFVERRRAVLRHRLFFTSRTRTAGLLLLL